ncbi:hypothetical protein D3C71_799580 [compost metagenome]
MSRKLHRTGVLEAGKSVAADLGPRQFQRGPSPHVPSPHRSRHLGQQPGPAHRRSRPGPDCRRRRTGRQRRRNRRHRPAPQRKHPRRALRRHGDEHRDPEHPVLGRRRHPATVRPRAEPAGRKLERPLRPALLHPRPRQCGLRLHRLAAGVDGHGRPRPGERLSQGLPPVRREAAGSAARAAGHPVRPQHPGRRHQDRHHQARRRLHRLRFDHLRQLWLDPRRGRCDPAGFRHPVGPRRRPVEPPRRLHQQRL